MCCCTEMFHKCAVLETLREVPIPIFFPCMATSIQCYIKVRQYHALFSVIKLIDFGHFLMELVDKNPWRADHLLKTKND